MTEQEAREILGEMIQPDGGLKDYGEYLAWNVGESSAVLDGTFGAEKLEAIAWWMSR